MVCIARRKMEKSGKSLQSQILEKISERDLSVRDLIAEFHCDPQPLLDTLKAMHENGLVKTDEAGIIKAC